MYIIHISTLIFTEYNSCVKGSMNNGDGRHGRQVLRFTVTSSEPGQVLWLQRGSQVVRDGHGALGIRYGSIGKIPQIYR